MKTQVITVRKLAGIWEDVSNARSEIVIATSPLRVNEVNAITAAYGVQSAFNLVEPNVLTISRDWTDEGWAEYRSMGPLNPAEYLAAGLEVSESIA